MDTRRLRYFVTLAEELHFGRAARRLNISQPPLSMQIRTLEDELGTSLFARDQRNVALTEAGRVLLIEARKILDQMRYARLATERAGRGEQGRLSVGFITPVEYNVLPSLLREFRRRYAGVSLVLREAMSDQQVSELEQGILDVGFLTAPVDGAALNHHVILRERLVVAIPRTHDLAKSTTAISVRRLAHESFIMFPRSIAPTLYDNTLRFCVAAGFPLRIEQEAAQSQTIVSLVSAGLGLAIVPESIRGLRRAGVIYRPFREQSPFMETVIAWRKGAVAPQVENFVRFVREQRQ